MKLSIDEFRRGLVSWEIAGPILCVTSADSLRDQVEWSEAIMTLSGSVAPVPRRSVRMVRFVHKDREGRDFPERIRWESLHESDSHIETRVWDDVAAEPTILHCVPNFGIFHRLVVATLLVTWPHDFVLRSGDVVVRLLHGQLVGERVGGIESVAASRDHVTVETEPIGTAAVSGRFVEIIAPGQSPEGAEIAAFAMLGYVGLCLGQHAIGEIVFSERYEAGPAGQTLAVDVPTLGQTPWPAHATEIAALELGMQAATAAVTENLAIALALRWYEHGIRADTPLDKLLAFFVGVEAVITDFGSRNAPLPIVRQRQEEYRQLLIDLEGQLTAHAFNDVKSKLIEPSQPSLPDYFRFYAERRALNEESQEWFRTARRVRNGVFHGGTLEVDVQTAANTRRLLGALLRLELGLPPMLRWEQSAGLLGLRMVSNLVPRSAAQIADE